MQSLFNKKTLKYVVSVAVFSVAAAGALFFLSSTEKTDYRLDEFDYQPPAKWEKSFKSYPVPHIVLNSKGLDRRKYVFNTADCGIIKHGYKNRIELFVIFDQDKKIENVILGKNIETPDLIKKMQQSGFFNSWNGLNRHIEVEYISGATYSSKAVSDNIKELFRILKHKGFID